MVDLRYRTEEREEWKSGKIGKVGISKESEATERVKI